MQQRGHRGQAAWSYTCSGVDTKGEAASDGEEPQQDADDRQADDTRPTTQATRKTACTKSQATVMQNILKG
mgnify:CR=1 FL=1